MMENRLVFAANDFNSQIASSMERDLAAQRAQRVFEAWLKSATPEDFKNLSTSVVEEERNDDQDHAEVG